jgi:hypothetical protein
VDDPSAFVAKALAAERKMAAMEEALKTILETTNGGCSRLTSGIGSCFTQPAWTKDAQELAFRVCDQCIAWEALTEVPTEGE